ncbi:MAG: SHOCT domain-containing protein [Kiritimatiellae bacterium]|nr:SHOCT domain-containing protein [Kiritimatiellia bacterium]
MKIPLKAIFPVLTALSIGCATPELISERYKPAKAMFPKPEVKRICVLKPRESRPLGKDSSTAMGLLAFIPVVPFMPERLSPESCISRPDGKEYNFPQDLGLIVTKDLQTSGIARNITYIDASTAAKSTNTASCYLHLNLREGVWRRKFTTYGLSISACPFWLFGAPISYGHFDLKIEAELTDTNNRSLGKAFLNAKVPLKEYIYSSDPLSDSILKAYSQISPRLKNFIAFNSRKTHAEATKTEKKKTTPKTGHTPSEISITERLKKLQKLKNSELITEEDYRKKKQSILSEL